MKLIWIIKFQKIIITSSNTTDFDKVLHGLSNWVKEIANFILLTKVKRIWKNSSSIRKHKVLTSPTGLLETQNSEHRTEEIIMKDILNNIFFFFLHSFTLEGISGDQHTPTNQNNNTYLSRCLFQVNDILHSISMKINKRPGQDKISPRMLRKTKSKLVRPLSILFNKLFITGKVSLVWKLANVTPVLKKKKH